MLTLEKQDAQLIELKAAGTIDKEDYDAVLPKLNEAIDRHGKLRVLIDATDLQNISPTAAVQDLDWDIKHRNDIEKCAAIVDSKFTEFAIKTGRLIYDGDIQTFEPGQEDRARQWLHTA